jgi:hypothetical protein
MKTATDFSKSIKRQITNTLYEVSLNGSTNVLYIDPETQTCRIVFDFVDMAKDSVCVACHKRIGTNDMVVLDWKTNDEPMGHRREALLRDGYVVRSDDNDRTAFFDTVSGTENSGLFYCRKVNGELNLMNAFGETMFADNDECRLIYISDIFYQNRYVVVIYANRNNGKNEYNIFDLANVEYVFDENVDYVTPCYFFYKHENGEFRFIKIFNNECCLIEIEAESQKVLAKFKCKSVDNQKQFLVNADEELIPFSTLEDYFDNTLKVATQNTTKDTKPTEQVFRLTKENGTPKQIALNIEDDGSYSIKVTY